MWPGPRDGRLTSAARELAEERRRVVGPKDDLRPHAVALRVRDLVLVVLELVLACAERSGARSRGSLFQSLSSEALKRCPPTPLERVFIEELRAYPGSFEVSRHSQGFNHLSSTVSLEESGCVLRETLM